MPDILSVSVQNIVHGGQPELRESKITDFVSARKIRDVSSDFASLLIMRLYI